MKMIDKHNQEYNLGNHSFTMAMNAFGDLVSVARIAELWVVLPLLSTSTRNLLRFSHSFPFQFKTSEELRQVMNGFQKQKYRKKKVFEEHPLAEIPPSVNWRETGCVTPLKDQVGHY